MAKWFIIAGSAILLIGIALRYAPWLVNWFGRLPGDIRHESDGVGVYLPITSMIVISIVLSVVVSVVRRL